MREYEHRDLRAPTRAQPRYMHNTAVGVGPHLGSNKEVEAEPARAMVSPVLPWSWSSTKSMKESTRARRSFSSWVAVG